MYIFKHLNFPGVFVYLFVAYLTTLSVAQDYITSNDRIINEQLIGKDVEGS
jgi:hypothetical protein